MKASFSSLLSLCTLLASTLTSARQIADPKTNGNDQNLFAGRVFYANSHYGNQVKAAIEVIKAKNDTLTAAKAANILEVGTYWWMSTAASVAGLPALVQEARIWEYRNNKEAILQLVVYNLPDRDCSAKASEGEFKLSDGGLEKYRAYIDSIAGYLKNYSDMRFALVLEPDGLANLVTNANPETGPPKCVGAIDAYKNSVAYAIAKLQFPHVSLYIDAGHGGWLGWADNLAPSARIFAEVLAIANKITKGSKLRGFALNTSNYNTYNQSVVEPFYEYNPSYTENLFANNLAPKLREYGIEAHFIVDTGRSGVMGIRTAGGQWCNVKGAGFGHRPTAMTNDSLIDALVWTKPGGESDGTSDRTAARFDETCGSEAAFQPAPEAGQWFQAYFEMLVKNANPPLPPLGNVSTPVTTSASWSSTTASTTGMVTRSTAAGSSSASPPTTTAAPPIVTRTPGKRWSL